MSDSPPRNSHPFVTALQQWRLHAGGWLRFVVLFSQLAGLCLLAQAWLIAQIINAVAFQHANLTAVQPWLWALLPVFGLRAVFVWASERCASQAAAQVKQAMRQRLYAHLQAVGTAWLGETSSGALVTTLSDGIDALEAYYARYLPAMSLVIGLPLAILLVVVIHDWWSALILLVTAPLIPLFMVLIGNSAEQRNQQQWQQLTRMNTHFLDVIQGLTTLKLFNASRREAQRVAAMAERYRHTTMSVLRIAFLSALVLEFFATVSIALVAVLIGFRLLWGEMAFVDGFFVLLLAPEFYLPLRQLGTQYHARMQAIAAAEQMVAILATPVPNRGTQPAPVIQDLPIHLENLGFTYPDGRCALQDIQLTISPNTTLAIVGASGAGKTTLLHVLLGLLEPQHGCIRLGDRPLTEYDRQTWWQQIAWLPQHPTLFSGSVADNIRLGNREATLSAVYRAAQQAQADAFIRELPQGYDTRIGETGRGLSGGQIQRIALARAFLKNAPLLLLDEATANVDKVSEAAIQSALQLLCRGRTVVMIAHRLHTIQHADHIVVLEQGRIIAQGTHAQLQTECAAYRAYLQASEVTA